MSTIFYAAIAFLTALAIGAVAAIGAGIARQLRPARTPSRWLTGVAVGLLAIVLLFTLFEWTRHLLPIASVFRTARVDRLQVFGEFVAPADIDWRRPESVNRSVSACETDARERRPTDAFTRQLRWFCEAAPDSPHVHSTNLVMVALHTGSVVEFEQAGTVGVKPGSESASRGSAGRLYAEQQEFSTPAEYRAAVKDYCASRPTDSICVTLAGDSLR